MKLAAAQAPGTQAISTFNSLRAIPGSSSEKPPLPEPDVEKLCRLCAKNPGIAGRLEQKSLVPGHIIRICKLPGQGKKMNVLFFGPEQGILEMQALLDQLCGPGQNGVMQKIEGPRLKRLMRRYSQLHTGLKRSCESVLAYQINNISSFSPMSRLFGQKPEFEVHGKKLKPEFWNESSSGETMGLFGSKIEGVPLSEIIRQKVKVDSNALRYFAAGLTAADAQVRTGALNGLLWLAYQIEIPFAVSLLSAVLGSDPAEEIRIFSAKILRALAAQPRRNDLQRAVPSLAKATFDNSGNVAAEARSALVFMQEQGYDMEPASRVIEDKLRQR